MLDGKTHFARTLRENQMITLSQRRALSSLYKGCGLSVLYSEVVLAIVGRLHASYVSISYPVNQPPSGESVDEDFSMRDVSQPAPGHSLGIHNLQKSSL